MQNYSEKPQVTSTSSNFEHLFQPAMINLQTLSRPYQTRRYRRKLFKSGVSKKLFTDAPTEQKKTQPFSSPEEQLLCEDCYSRNQRVQTSGILSHPTEFWAKNLEIKCDGSCVPTEVQSNQFRSNEGNVEINWEEWQKNWFQLYRPWVDVDPRMAYTVGQFDQCFCENC